MDRVDAVAVAVANTTTNQLMPLLMPLSNRHFWQARA